MKQDRAWLSDFRQPVDVRPRLRFKPLLLEYYISHGIAHAIVEGTNAFIHSCNMQVNFPASINEKPLLQLIDKKRDEAAEAKGGMDCKMVNPAAPSVEATGNNVDCPAMKLRHQKQIRIALSVQLNFFF